MSLVSRTVRVSRMVAAVTAVFALAGCGDDDPASPNAPAACTGAVTVTVSGGTTPTFSWTPQCAIVALIVEEGADDRWSVFANSDAGFGPGVVYGSPPVGGSQTAVAQPLRAGVLHNVTLFRGPLSAPVVSTTKSFTP
jgi:hypothetical protein